MDKQIIEILKKPFFVSPYLVSAIVGGFYPKFKIEMTKESFPSIQMMNKEDTWNIDIHYDKEEQDAWGKYELHGDDHYVLLLENYFEYPLLPTKEERGLFYIEHGVEYPIPEYKEEMIE